MERTNAEHALGFLTGTPGRALAALVPRRATPSTVWMARIQALRWSPRPEIVQIRGRRQGRSAAAVDTKAMARTSSSAATLIALAASSTPALAHVAPWSSPDPPPLDVQFLVAIALMAVAGAAFVWQGAAVAYESLRTGGSAVARLSPHGSRQATARLPAGSAPVPSPAPSPRVAVIRSLRRPRRRRPATAARSRTRPRSAPRASRHPGHVVGRCSASSPVLLNRACA